LLSIALVLVGIHVAFLIRRRGTNVATAGPWMTVMGAALGAGTVAIVVGGTVLFGANTTCTNDYDCTSDYCTPCRL
jgi:hypothetical protein